MQLKLTLIIEQISRDIILEAEPTETIGAVALYILQNVGVAWQMQLPTYLSPTLSFLVDGNHILIAPHTILRDAQLVDGAIVELTSYIYSDRLFYQTTVYGVVEHLNSGVTYPLMSIVTIGRSASSDIQLNCQKISRLQAQISIVQANQLNPSVEQIQVIDCGSLNGTEYSQGSQTIEIVSEQLQIKLFSCPIHPTIEPLKEQWYNRNHILPQLMESQTLELPQKPAAKEPAKLQILNLLLPIIMCTVLYFVMPNPMTLLFFAMSPLIMFGNWISSKFSIHKQNQQQQLKYQDKINEIQNNAKELKKQECEKLYQRYAEYKQLPLWSKHLQMSDFSTVRFGISNYTSNITVGKEVSIIENAPHIFDLASGVGIFGEVEQLNDCVNGLLLQILQAYAPSELRIILLSGTSDHSLKWMKWSQNIDHELSACNNQAIENSIHRLEQIIETRKDFENQDSVILLLIQSVSQRHVGKLEQVIKHGKDCEVYCLWIGNIESEISYQVDCRIEIIASHQDYKQSSSLNVRKIETGVQQIVCQYQTAKQIFCEQYIKSIAPLKDLSQTTNNNVLIPKYLEYQQLLKHDILNSVTAILTNWSDSSRIMDAPIGQTSSGVCALNLRKIGPHALVGGTTGAGKSEFLQSWICAMAIQTSPQRLNFLLVDYKGGAAFSECVKFPHTVGLVTDLNNKLAKRVMVSLSAEIKRREEILQQFNAKDLATLEQQHLKYCPPSLVIVVDEFAALANEIPQFVDEIVDIAARGRSLGIHLIMATQRPSGVIKDNLKANTNLRIALRVADEIESKDIIGADFAAKINREIPGRFFYKVDTNSPIEVQCAYVGYKVDYTASRIVVQDFELGQLQNWNCSQSTSHLSPVFLQQLTKQLQYAYLSSGISAPKRPWCTPLEQQLRLNWQHPMLGMVDKPEQQSQNELALDDKNWLITGTSASGKTTTIETFTACAFHNANFDRIVIINAMKSSFGEQVAKIAQIIELHEIEKIIRLFNTMRTDDLSYCLLIDGIDIMKDECENNSEYQILSNFLSLLSNSTALRVQIIATQNRVGGIFHSWTSFFIRKIYLELASDTDYSIVGIPTDALPSTKNPGRGLLNNNEIQIHQVDWQAPEFTNILQINEQKSILSTALPTAILEKHYSANLNYIGISADKLEPLVLNESTGAIYVIGPPKSGKSTVAHVIKQHLRTKGVTKSIQILNPNCDDNEINQIINSDNIIEVSLYQLSNNWNLNAKIKQANTVILLGVSASDAITIFNAHYQDIKYIPLEYSRGYLIHHGQAELVQFTDL